MIAAKYRLFSAEPKASKFPRYAHTEEVAVLGIFDLGRHAISPGWFGYRKLSGFDGGISRLLVGNWLGHC